MMLRIRFGTKTASYCFILVYSLGILVNVQLKKKKKENINGFSYCLAFPPFFISPLPLFSFRYYKEVQTVSEHIHNCLGSQTGGFVGVKKLQKFLGRPFPFKVYLEAFSK